MLAAALRNRMDSRATAAHAHAPVAFCREILDAVAGSDRPPARGWARAGGAALIGPILAHAETCSVDLTDVLLKALLGELGFSMTP